VVVLSFADEGAFHRNYPSACDSRCRREGHRAGSYLPPQEDRLAAATTTDSPLFRHPARQDEHRCRAACACGPALV